VEKWSRRRKIHYISFILQEKIKKDDKFEANQEICARSGLVSV
jgi:hypothetical protein